MEHKQQFCTYSFCMHGLHIFSTHHIVKTGPIIQVSWWNHRRIHLWRTSKVVQITSIVIWQQNTNHNLRIWRETAVHAMAHERIIHTHGDKITCIHIVSIERVNFNENSQNVRLFFTRFWSFVTYFVLRFDYVVLADYKIIFTGLFVFTIIEFTSLH